MGLERPIRLPLPGRQAYKSCCLMAPGPRTATPHPAPGGAPQDLSPLPAVAIKWTQLSPTLITRGPAKLCVVVSEGRCAAPQSLCARCARGWEGVAGRAGWGWGVGAGGRPLALLGRLPCMLLCCVCSKPCVIFHIFVACTWLPSPLPSAPPPPPRAPTAAPNTPNLKTRPAIADNCRAF